MLMYLQPCPWSQKSKEATAQAEVVEDDTALDDEESLGMDATDQVAVLPTGGNVSTELE